MKVIKTLLFALLTFATIQTATAGTEPTTSTAREIKNLLDDAFNKIEVESETKVYITFMITESNEIVVVNTSNDTFDDTIKNKLNYKNIISNDLQKGKKYTLPVTLIKS